MAQPIDIRPGDLAIVQKILRDALPADAKVWVFGSRAKWTTKDSSDLDLVIDVGRKLLRGESIELDTVFEESDLPYKVDVVDWHSVADSFKAVIERDRVVLPRWEEVKLGEVARFVVDKIKATNVSTQNYISTDNMLVNRGGIVAASSIPKVAKFNHYKPSDILFSNIRTYFRKIWYSDREGGASADVLIFRPKDPKKLNSRYLFYVLSSQEFVNYTNLTSKGAKMPRGDKEAIMRYPFKLSKDIEDQKAVSDVLSALDNKIELNRKMNATLEETARALFKSWFVDFDPVRAKMEGRTPDGLTPDLAALFPDTLVDSPLGPIPKGWEVKSVSELAKVVKGRSYKSSELQDSDVALVTLKSFSRGGGYRKDGLKAFSGSYKPEQEVAAGDLVVAFTDVTQQADVIGKPAIVSASKDFRTLVASLDVGIIRPINPDHRLFYYFLFKTEIFQNHVYGHTSGTTVLHLGKEGIPSFKLPYASNEKLVDEYCKIANNAYQRIAENDAQITELTELRDALLPKLISGDLRVSEATSGIKEVV